MQQLYEVFDFLAGQFYLWHCLLLEVLHEHGAEDRRPRGEDLPMDVQLVALDHQDDTRHLIDDGEVKAATFHACNDRRCIMFRFYTAKTSGPESSGRSGKLHGQSIIFKRRNVTVGITERQGTYLRLIAVKKCS